MKKIKKSLIICLIFIIIMLGMGMNYSAETSFVLIDGESGRVLFEKNADVKKRIASLTKIATCITAIELLDLADEVCIKKEWTGIEGSSIYLRENEKLTVSDLLYGLMLRSGNDAATALCGYSRDRKLPFIKIMNDIALNVGANNTCFVNPHGLDRDGHFSTARDMALLCAYCMKNEEFARVVGTKKIVVGDGESKRELVNKNKLLYRYPYAEGIKTGYTKKSGRCLASSAVKDGFRLICVVLDCPSTYEVTEGLFNDGYKKYERTLLQSKNVPVCFYERNGKSLPCYVESDVFYPLTIDEKSSVTQKYFLSYNGDFPVKSGTEMGRIEFYLQNQLLFSRKIYNIIA